MLGRFFTALSVLAVCGSAAAAVDVHEFWDGRCGDCHGHAGGFARRHLTVQDGKLIGRHNTDLNRFLEHHESGGAQASAIYQMLLAQAQTQPVYQQKCAGCHDTAAQFARSSLERRGGVVVGKTNGRPISEFLKLHGKLSPAEVPVVVDSLTRVLSETVGPPAK